MKIKKFFLLINIFFFLYFAVQLLFYTDEFAFKNLGYFNHAIAGLSELIGIIFFSFFISLILIMFYGMEKQLPLFLTIFLIQFIIAINFWRYVLTNSPGETNLNIITFNAIIFSLVSLISFYILININKNN
tara:strand:+ start:24370 stop:24762 length:393 start_codon:yes stop_codon:yes gene_type:complete